jgi:hypothetical protein
MSARKSQLHADQEAWEDNRLIQSGVAAEREVGAHVSSDILINLMMYWNYRFKQNLIMKKMPE